MLRVAVIAIALCGCQDKQLADVKAVRDEVCACKDVACGEAAIKKVPPTPGRPSHRAQTLASEMMACMSKLYLKDRPDEDPDAKPGPDLTVPDLLPSDGGLRLNFDAKDRIEPRN